MKSSSVLTIVHYPNKFHFEEDIKYGFIHTERLTLERIIEKIYENFLSGYRT